MGGDSWDVPSFGYNRFDEESDYEDAATLVRSFVDTVSKNGNLLLNVGPRGEDASIPEMQTRRLDVLGTWLDRQGEAIFETRPCAAADSETNDGTPVRFTRNGETIYAILLGAPSVETVRFTAPFSLPRIAEVQNLGSGLGIAFSQTGSTIELSRTGPIDPTATAFRLRPSDARIPTASTSSPGRVASTP